MFKYLKFMYDKPADPPADPKPSDPPADPKPSDPPAPIKIEIDTAKISADIINKVKESLTIKNNDDESEDIICY